jgi:DeoR/GlpR family transcriptional regulator of sugar metabolism
MQIFAYLHIVANLHMSKEERFEIILKELTASDRVTYEGLSISLSVSEDTIRRDVDHLNRSGLLVKVRGGAVSPSKNPLSYREREGIFTEGKNMIALKALQLLKNVRTVYMDGGTTIRALASMLPTDARFRVITNNVSLVPILTTYPGVEVVVLGGYYNRITRTNVGQQTCMEAALYQADIYMMGICSLHSDIGVMASVLEDGEVKKAIMKSSRKVVALSNFEKLETTDCFRVCGMDAVDTLVTDLKSDDRRLDVFRKFDLEIL